MQQGIAHARHIVGRPRPRAQRAAPARALAGAWQLPMRAGLALARRPMLALTLAALVVLLISAAGETMTAWQLQRDLHQARARTQSLQDANAAMQRQIDQQQTDSVVIAAATRLGWVFPTPTTLPASR